MDRKGQIGKLVVTVPVMILVVVIMLGFVGLSYISSISHSSKNLAKSNFEGSEDILLLKKVNLDQTQILVMDLMVKLNKKEIERDKVKEILSSLVNQNNNCLLLAYGESGNPGSYTGGKERNNLVIQFINGEFKEINLGSQHSKFAEYRDKGLLQDQKIVVDGADLYLDYYHGKCLEEKNE